MVVVVASLLQLVTIKVTYIVPNQLSGLTRYAESFMLVASLIQLAAKCKGNITNYMD